jgi:hypothetical protein
MKELPAGYIFSCSDATEAECFERSLFGGTEKYRSRVSTLKKGDTMFLWNLNSKKLYGVFEATSDLKSNIVPGAWSGEFPLQVRVKRVANYKPISREDIPRELIGFDMTGKPSSRLSLEKVVALKEIFKGKKRTRIYDDLTRYVTHDGHKVRSKAEQAIDNWLYKHRIAHGYEAQVGTKRCDFEIPTKGKTIYIEYWGLEDTKYLKNKLAKLKLYKSKGLDLVSLYPKDLKNIDKILKQRILGRLYPRTK